MSTSRLCPSIMRLDKTTARNVRGEASAIIHAKFDTKVTSRDCLTVDLQPVAAGTEYIRVYFAGTISLKSISGASGTSISGQCSREIKHYWGHLPEVSEYCDLWDRWHENDHRLGTRNQYSALEGTEDLEFTDYEKWVKSYLSDVGLYSDHGHVWGSDILIELVPAQVLTHLFHLIERVQVYSPTSILRCSNG